MKKNLEAETIIRCNFCSKRSDDVGHLISGPGPVYICDKCVDICVEILDERGYSIRTYRLPKEVDLENLGIKPRFKTLKFEIRQNHCFHLCPFAEPFNTIYNDHVVSAARAAGFTVERADEIFGTEPIIEDIWQAINSASIITADVTGRNPNVMYEIGMAHTVGKPVIIMTQTMDDVPFDLKHYRCIVYQYTPRGCSTLEERLISTMQFLRVKGK